jgi:hypothetical protein
MTIEEAFEQLRQIFPDRRKQSLTVELDVWEHASNDGRDIEFRVWDGSKGHTGPTLEIAVQKCLIHNTAEQAKPEEAEAAVVEAESLQTVANA